MAVASRGAGASPSKRGGPIVRMRPRDCSRSIPETIRCELRLAGHPRRKRGLCRIQFPGSLETLGGLGVCGRCVGKQEEPRQQPENDSCNLHSASPSCYLRFVLTLASLIVLRPSDRFWRASDVAWTSASNHARYAPRVPPICGDGAGMRADSVNSPNQFAMDDALFVRGGQCLGEAGAISGIRSAGGPLRE